MSRDSQTRPIISNPTLKGKSRATLRRLSSTVMQNTNGEIKHENKKDRKHARG